MEGVQQKVFYSMHSRFEGFDLEVAISSVLMFGVSLSMIFILIGIFWQYIDYGSFIASYTLPKANFFAFLLDVLRKTFDSKYTPHLSIDLGIVVLMLTPYVRIMASALYFAFVEKNTKYTVFTLIVLTALSYSLFLR